MNNLHSYITILLGLLLTQLTLVSGVSAQEMTLQIGSFNVPLHVILSGAPQGRSRRISPPGDSASRGSHSTRMSFAIFLQSGRMA